MLYLRCKVPKQKGVTSFTDKSAISNVHIRSCLFFCLPASSRKWLSRNPAKINRPPSPGTSRGGH